MGRNVSNLAEKLESLTPQQVARVEEFIESLRTRGHERALAHEAAAASTPAFETIWSNPEDDAYDAL